jgi:lipopolysaccharide export system protein LptC
VVSTREMLVIGALAAGAFASWYLSRPNGQGETQTTALDSARSGYYLKSARILGTGEDGRLLYELQAREAEQVGSNRVTFTDVQIKYSPQSDVPWSVNADTATIYADEQRVQLEGHVSAVSRAGFSGNETEIRTQYLDVYPEEFLAETDDRVQIRIGERSLTATGMLASLRDNQVKLKSNVRGKFAP